MGFFDALLGRSKPPPPKKEPLFALVTALVTLQVKLGWAIAGRAGLVFRPVSTQEFQEIAKELQELLKLAGEEMESKFETNEDEYNYQWFLFSDPDGEDLVTLVHLAAQTLSESGFGGQLLAAVFRFQDENRHEKGPLYLVFNYKQGKFYPFLPQGNKKRNEAEEMRVYSALERELPWEKDLNNWYPLWGCPV